MKKLILLITAIIAPTLSFSTSWTDPSWEEMIREAEIIGLFEVTEGGLDDAVIKPIKLLKGTTATNITISGFNNNFASEDAQNERALKEKQKAYLFIHRWRTEYSVPTPSTGIIPLNEGDNVNYFTLWPSWFRNLPAHPTTEFESFITNTIWFQEHGAPNEEPVEKLRFRIQQEIANANTNSLPDHLVYYRLWGGRDWIEGLESITNNVNSLTRFHAAELLGEMLPSKRAETLLMNLLNDPDSRTQSQAVTSLMSSGNTHQTLELLTKKLAASVSEAAAPTTTNIGGQLAIIAEIKKHEYAEASNELVAIAKQTQNQVVLYESYRTLKKLGSPALSAVIATQLHSNDPYMVNKAIRLSSYMPKPVEPELREALESALTRKDPSSYETSLIFESLTSESLPMLLPTVNSILKRGQPKRGDADYLQKVIELTDSSSPLVYHEMVDRILYYWIGVDSRALSHPGLLKKKIELENHYERRILSTSVIDEKKYKTESSAFVTIDFTKAVATPNAETPPHTYRIMLEMTVPADDADSPFEAITESHGDRSKISPLLIWRRAIAAEADIPVTNVGIFCHPSSGRGGHTNRTDERIESKSGIMRAYVRYARRTQNKNAIALVELMLDSFLASHMGCAEICLEIRK